MLDGHRRAAAGMSGEMITRQGPVGSYPFSSTVLLAGAPLPQQHAVVPTVSFIHSPQMLEACLAKCNFRSHWLTTVVHELVNDLYIIQSSYFGFHGVWFVAADLWNAFLSSSLPGLQYLHLAPLLQEAILKNRYYCQDDNFQRFQYTRP